MPFSPGKDAWRAKITIDKMKLRIFYELTPGRWYGIVFVETHLARRTAYESEHRHLFLRRHRQLSGPGAHPAGEIPDHQVPGLRRGGAAARRPGQRRGGHQEMGGGDRPGDRLHPRQAHRGHREEDGRPGGQGRHLGGHGILRQGGGRRPGQGAGRDGRHGRALRHQGGVPQPQQGVLHGPGPAPSGPRDGEFQQVLPAAGLRLGHERRHLPALLHPQV